jgi:hypothetical protein
MVLQHALLQMKKQLVLILAESSLVLVASPIDKLLPLFEALMIAHERF